MTWNPFDWTAGPFLTLYVCSALIMFVLIFKARMMIGPAPRITQKLSALEIAYLAGGPQRLGDAALLHLASWNGATITLNGDGITVTDQTPLAALMRRPPILSFSPGMTRKRFQSAVKPLVERVQSQLQEFGYYPSDAQMMSFRIAALPFVGLLIMFGIMKIVIGSQRHHPVDILIFLVVITAIAGFVAATRPNRTQAGRDAIDAYRASHERAARAPLDQELLLALALTGPVVLSGTAHASVYAASQTMSSSSGGSGCGGSGCGGGGGGGCGGCS